MDIYIYKMLASKNKVHTERSTYTTMVHIWLPNSILSVCTREHFASKYYIVTRSLEFRNALWMWIQMRFKNQIWWISHVMSSGVENLKCEVPTGYCYPTPVRFTIVCRSLRCRSTLTCKEFTKIMKSSSKAHAILISKTTVECQHSQMSQGQWRRENDTINTSWALPKLK